MSILVNTADHIEILNDRCFCIPAQGEKMQALLTERLCRVLDVDPVSAYKDFKPFSDAAVFLRKKDSDAMADLIQAMELVVKLPEYQKLTHQRHSNLVKNTYANTFGLMMGYDFHITPDGPKLIEINTNAGGAFVAKMLCGQAVESTTCCNISNSAGQIEHGADDALYQMFLDEWNLIRPSQMLKTVAIVDENVKKQYLYPDMVLAAKLLTDKGIDAFVCDLKDLHYLGASVFYQDKKIDMIYNRLTDFMLESFECKQLRAAYEYDHVVLSPTPNHHALYADKRNLELLSNEKWLFDIGVDEVTRKVLSIVPDTKEFSKLSHEKCWQDRKKYFFKPHSGYGSRGVFRGDKLTKKVWEDIKLGGFIAQEFIQPSTRNTDVLGDRKRLKYDIRVYAYAGKPLFLAARLYSGQTTNFRTAGGGFAEVIVL